MRQSTALMVLFIVAASFLLGWGCAGPSGKAPYVKGGKEYGTVQGAFRHRWWNYYERGLSFFDGAYYPEAIADLESAVHQREKDQRMARTYGMHFVDYFPHRELGIVFLEVGNLERAKNELERSLVQYPTAKARFYLDRTRKALILKEDRPVVPPSIRLDIEGAEIRTRDDPVVLSGIVRDENYVAAISIRGVPLFIKGSEKQIRFKEKLRLPQGRHRIVVLAENLGGISAKRGLIVHVDRQGPLITLEALVQDHLGPGPGMVVKGSLFDDAGVADLSINGVPVSIEKGRDVFFNETILPHNHGIEIVARDTLGNETRALIPVSAGTSMSTGPVLLAHSDANQWVAGLFGSQVDRPPKISIAGWVDGQAVYLEKIYLGGQVAGDSDIVELTINHVSALRRAGRMIFFGHVEPLKEGDNRITIKATDKAGNSTIHELTIHRKIPVALKLDQRLRVSVMPFEQKGDISIAGLSFQDNLIHALVGRNRFRLVERQLLETILQEHKISRTDLVDHGTAVKLGRLAAAQSIITGSIIESRKGIEIISRFVDTETAEILDVEDVYGEVKDMQALKSLAEGLALKIHRQFPLVGGIVIQKKGNDIVTDMGEQTIGVQKRLIVYREAPVVHPVTGEVLGADSEIIGHARIKQVSPEISKAALIDPKETRVDVLDKVVTE